MIFPNQNVPRWIIFLIDTVLVLLSLFFAFMLRFEFNIPQNEIGPLIFALPVYMMVRIVSFIFGNTFSGIIRYTSTEDSVRIFKTILIGSVIMALFNPLKYFLWDGAYFLPFSIIILDGLIASCLLIVFRIVVKMLYLEFKNPRSERTGVIIYGAGEAGVITKRTLERDSVGQSRVIAFIDDNQSKQGKRLEGARIYHTSGLAKLLEKNPKGTNLVISIQNPDTKNKRMVLETALKMQTKVLNVPPVNTWINGELSVKQLKNVRIEDLLGRKIINLDDGKVNAQIKGKTVLVTGAAGSIGSGLVRQIAGYNPKLIVALDQAESPIYDLEIALRNEFPEISLEVVIADIRRLERMKNVFGHFKPEVVYHAAAYKHVPLMELNPTEAVLTNVLGSKNLVDLSMEFNVETFVLISTDKAVNPTNVMGSTKRVAEIYAQSNNGVSDTNFITTRFGNVLGSNGSVIPLFRKQIEEGGPLTVTHPEITRFFMTIPEACQLVLEAGAMGKGGEIFVFDMGESVKIIDLAKQMIKLSGLELDKDISIKISGMRPGEKLYEELLNSEENTVKTHHPQILIANVRPYNLAKVQKDILELIDLFGYQNNEALVRKIKSIVPEFKSNNSEFSKLDAPSADSVENI